MAEPLVLNTSVGSPSISAKADLLSQQIPPPIPESETCPSKNCIHKIRNKADTEEAASSKKHKKQKKKKKIESDSESSDAEEESSSSSESSESDKESSSSESSSSDEDSKSRRGKKGKSKAKKGSKHTLSKKDPVQPVKTKSKKSKQVQYVVEDEDSASSESSSEESGSDGLDDLKKELEAKGLFKGSKKQVALLNDILKLASKGETKEEEVIEIKPKKSSKADRKSKSSTKASKTQPVKEEKKSRKEKKEVKVEESEQAKSKFKRLDEIWDESLYDYRLRETTDKKVTDEYEKYIFTVRRKFDVENHYQSTTVDIKSLPLKECLKVVMEGVEGISLVEKTPKLLPDMLFLYLEDFREYSSVLIKTSKTCGDKKLKKTLKAQSKHLDVLIGYLDKDYDDMKKTLYPMLANGTITFDLLWTLYKPNSLAYKATYGDDNHPRAFRIEYASKERNYMGVQYYDIEGKYLDYDGEKFGPAYINAEVPQFQGPRRITALPCYPLSHHPKAEELKGKLVERGKRFLSLAGMNYKFCNGTCFAKKDNKILKVNINGRVMIDPKTFRRINPNYPLGIVEQRDNEDEEIECRCEKTEQPPMPKKTQDRLFVIDKKDDNEVDVIEMATTDPRAPDNLTDAMKRTELSKLTFTEEEVMTASPLLPGFCFSEKLWVELTVSTITEVKWNDKAFDSLVIPEKHKSIVRALVSAHGQHASKSIDDVVSGKGKGLVAVLHGKPGLGKTLTCEAVSDLLKRPLYAVSAGDLGTSVTHLELQLQSILDISHCWGAVLLLDEADVFLEERSNRDVHRNAMVSVFLRLLEYHQGILFLTTNRVETFDEAFVSRIHLSLRYSDLTVQARRAIWKTFITKVADTVTAPATSTETAEDPSTGIPTPDTTSSTPNSGTVTPVPFDNASVNMPATPTTSASTDSIDSDKTITLASTKTPDPETSTAASLDALPSVAVEKITEANYVELSRIELNGRQIKNLVKTAQALALYEGVPMSMGHLRRCIEVGRSFELDLKGGRGWEDVMRSYT